MSRRPSQRRPKTFERCVQSVKASNVERTGDPTRPYNPWAVCNASVRGLRANPTRETMQVLRLNPTTPEEVAARHRRMRRAAMQRHLSRVSAAGAWGADAASAVTQEFPIGTVVAVGLVALAIGYAIGKPSTPA